ncbi:Carboxypeptidase B [Halotydeus destructor]|nr:Carboxypeptidase B [Halotydeus destructor]
MVPPRMRQKLETSLRNMAMSQEYLIDDVGSVVDKERDSLDIPQLLYRSPGAYTMRDGFFDNYHRLADIHDYMDQLAAENSEIASTFNIGKSFEGRNLMVLKIGSKGRARATKPAILIDGGIHAREWVAVSSVLYIAQRLVNDYEDNPGVARLVDHFDWYLLPVANPDGYEYTHTNDRMWRKTRSITHSRWGCRGVDPNRNFDFHWNEVGTSDNPCSEIYAGARAFSEIESRAVAEFIMRKKDTLKLYLAVHSYSQLWLTPWGYTDALPDNYRDLMPLPVGADDWAHGVAGIPYVYTVELRDKGKYGFLLPRNQILPTGEETWEGVKAISDEIRINGRRKK